MTEDNPAPIRVALVDDQQLVRSGFGMLINSQPDLEVVAEAGSGSEAVRRLSATHADVVLMDVRMPGMDGIETTRQLLNRTAGTGGAPANGTTAGTAGQSPAPGTGPGSETGLGTQTAPGTGPSMRIVVLTTFDLDEYALSAIQAGASGFLLKDAPPEELLEAIRTVHRGDAVIAPSTTRRLLDHVAPLLNQPGPEQDKHRAAVDTLTVREREVFVLMAQGLSNPEIAGQLYLSEATVKTHVGHILAKLQARDRVQAVVMAYETGLVRAN